MTRRLAVLAVFVAACSSFGADDPGPVTVSPPADAGAAEAGNVDAGADTRSFCERLARRDGETTYCRDFDDGTPAEFDWSSTTLSSGAAMSIDTVERFSPPGALLAHLDANAQACAYARAIRRFEVSLSRVHVAFDVRLGVEGVAKHPGTSFMVLNLGACALILSGEQTGGNVHEQRAGVDIQHPTSRFPLEKKWAHYDVDVDRQTGALEVSVDGVNAFTTPQQLEPACVEPSAFVELLPGLHCESSSELAREARIDNLVLTGIP